MLEPPRWSQRDAVTCEVAEDVVAYLIADCAARVRLEQERRRPDQERIDALEAEMARYVQQRHDLDGADPHAVAATLARYAALVDERYREDLASPAATEAGEGEGTGRG